MDVGAQLLQPLLVGDAEMLLLVDDQQAEVLELDALGQQRVGADHDVDRALLHAALVALASLAPTSRDSRPMRTGRPWKRSTKVR